MNRCLALIGCALGLCTTGLEAQGTTATVRVNLPVTNAITVLSSSSSLTDFGTIGHMHLQAGSKDVAGPVLRVRSNRAFAVSISASASTFGPASKPVSDVRWALSSGGPWTPLSLTPTTMWSASSGGDLTFATTLRMLLNLATDAPGLYQLSLTITLTAP